MPILFDIADRAAAHLGTSSPEAERLFQKTNKAPQTAISAFDQDDAPPEILFPPIGAELWAGHVDGRPARAFVLAGRGAGELNWYIDGVPSPIDDGGLPAWTPDKPGFYTVSVVDEAGRQAQRRVRVLQ